MVEIPTEARNRIQRQQSLLEEIRELYWTTDIPLEEIRDAYLPPRRTVGLVTAMAGPVWLGRYCECLIPELGDDVTCGEPLFARIRED